MEMLDQREEAWLVGRHLRICRPNQEGLVALVASSVNEVGCFSIGTGDDEARNTHDVELKAGRVQSLVLLVLRHEHFAALMATLLRARTLVLDVIARNAGFHKAADQVAHVGLATMASIGVGDDERAEVVGLRRSL